MIRVALAAWLLAATTLPQPPYVGQKTPGSTPEKFAPGVVSTDAIELNGVFTPDGREFFFTRIVEGTDTIYRSVFAGGGWSAPRPLALHPAGAKGGAVDMSVSRAGDELYFLGIDPPASGDAKPSLDIEARPSLDIWVSRKLDGQWSTARKVPPPVSTGADEIYPVVVADGSLYFASNREDGKRNHLYRAQRNADGTFAGPVKVGPPISSTEFGTGDTFVAPDESFMIFASRRPPGSGLADLFVSFREDGAWSAPSNLGPGVNTADYEFCPMVTPDGKYLFFSRRVGATWETTTAGDVYWVDVKVLDPFRPRP